MTRLMLLLLMFFSTSAFSADQKVDASVLSGSFIVTEFRSTGAIQALTERERDSIIGKKLIFRKSSAIFFGEDCEDVSYTVEAIARDDVIGEIKYIDEKPSLLPAVVTQVDVGCADVFLRSDGSIMFVWEGDIFIARRKSP